MEGRMNNSHDYYYKINFIFVLKKYTPKIIHENTFALPRNLKNKLYKNS